MAFKNFIKDNFVLVVGLALPVLLMFGFMIVSTLPETVGDPPKYDLVFSTPDGGNASVPVSVKLVVDKDGTLVAQYTSNGKPGGYTYNAWRKLYLYDAKTRKVRELPLPYPADADKISGMRAEPVEATKGMRLDTTLEAPDGYTLSYDGYSRSGLVGDLFIGGGGYSQSVRLRRGNSSVKITNEDNRAPFYYGQVEFIGWVTGTKP